MRNDKYILVDGQPQAEPDLLVWARWMESSGSDRVVSQEHPFPGILVSTVFLGLDYSFSEAGPPILWESMVFGGPLDGEMERYRSREEAQEGHLRMLERVLCAQNATGTQL